MRPVRPVQAAGGQASGERGLNAVDSCESVGLKDVRGNQVRTDRRYRGAAGLLESPARYNHAMVTIWIFLVGGIAFGFGLGVILGYFLGRRNATKGIARGFEVELTTKQSGQSPGG